jgi:signal peptidase I
VPAQRTGRYEGSGSGSYQSPGSYQEQSGYRPFGVDDTGNRPRANEPLPPAPDVFRRRTSSGKKRWPAWGRTLFVIGVCLVVLVVVHLFFYQAFSVRASSMSPTLQAGDRVLVNKVVYDFRDPHRGEIVLFHGDAPKWTPESSTDADSGMFANIGSFLGSLVGLSSPDSDEFYRRVIAVPGDTIACCDVNGHVTINGKPLDETYVKNDSPLSTSKNGPPCGARQFAPVVVSPDSVFVMGDNRTASLDSRCIEQVPMNKIVGRASAVIFGRWDNLSVPPTFGDVPKPYSLGNPAPEPADNQGGVVFVLPLIAGFAGRRAYTAITNRRGRSLPA